MKLDMSNPGAIKQAIVQACSDKKIRPGCFGVILPPGGGFFRLGYWGCCPLGACLVGTRIDNPHCDKIEVGLGQLGLSAAWWHAFYRGFDGYISARPNSWAYGLGRHLRNEYNAGRLGIQSCPTQSKKP